MNCAKLNGASVSFTDEGWIVNGVICDSYLVIAIAPVEYQRLSAKLLFKRAKNTNDDMIRWSLIKKGLKLREEAMADAECEVKWKAREEGN